MLTKSAAAFFKPHHSKFVALTATNSRPFSGGGPKRPPMPATENNFDLVIVGILSFFKILRWRQRYFSFKVYSA